MTGKYVRIAETQEFLENEMKVFKVEGHEILVVNVEGKFYAFENRCPYMGFPWWSVAPGVLAVFFFVEGIAHMNVYAVMLDVIGKPFVIKLNGKEIYNGSFWSPVSSKPYSGIIKLVLDNSAKIEKGYPSSEFFEGIDPRNDSEIFDYFQKVGKLIQ